MSSFLTMESYLIAVTSEKIRRSLCSLTLVTLWGHELNLRQIDSLILSGKGFWKRLIRLMIIVKENIQGFLRSQ